MLERSPVVHRNGANLHFDRHHLLVVHEVHGHAHDNVQAAVPVGLGVLDIVLHAHDFKVVLAAQQPHQLFHVVLVRANDANARNVHQVFFQVADSRLFTVAQQLVVDAHRRLHARLDMVNRVAIAPYRQITVKDLEADDHLTQGRFVFLQDGMHLAGEFLVAVKCIGINQQFLRLGRNG